jgi:replicative DNA helicase
VKHLARLSGFKIEDLEYGRIAPNDPMLIKAANQLAAVNLFYIGGNANALPSLIIKRVKEAQAVCGPDHLLLLVIDYLQYFARFFRGGNNTEQVGAALSSLRDMATQTSAALLVIGSQNRQTNTRPGTEIDMFGGRGSGEIEYDADTILSMVKSDNRHSDGAKMIKLKAVKTRFGGLDAEVDMIDYTERAFFKEKEQGDGWNRY